MINYILIILVSIQTASAEWKPVAGKLLTPWAAKLDPSSVWSEHPRPQLQRKNWTNLNGLWDYAIAGKDDEGGKSRVLSVEEDGENAAAIGSQFDGKILIPFCPESALSGVGRLIDPGEALWYQRELPCKPVAGERALLHFEAVDYETTVWVNDKEVGRHVGGNTPFSFDITAALAGAGNKILVRVTDATGGYQLNGKQALKPSAITYTRVSGIWQTVWLEQVPQRFLEDLDFETVQVKEAVPAGPGNNGKEQAPAEKVQLVIHPKLNGPPVPGETVRVSASFGGREVVSGRSAGVLTLEIPEPLWWTPERPNLYDLKVDLLNGEGKVVDSVQSYAALRTVGKLADNAGNLQIALNGSRTFLLGTLDQGWWPDGLLTPPSDEAMLAELEYLKAAGFNMVRKHVKIEPARYYYHCDRLGIAVWQDQVSAGLEGPPEISPRWIRMDSKPEDAIWPADACNQWTEEYKAMVDHLRDHPSILIWSLFNEAWGQHDSMQLGKMAKEYDPSRLISIASGGNFWPVGDIAAAHHYPEPQFPFADPGLGDFIKTCGEMGGGGWAVDGHLANPAAKNWGYGSRSNNAFEWKEGYSRTMEQLSQLRDQGLAAGVYTQTSDIESEVNGLMTCDRVPKVEAAWLKSINEKVIRGR